MQPVLTSYRRVFFERIAKKYPTVLIASADEGGSGFGSVATDMETITVDRRAYFDGRLVWQRGVLKNLKRVRATDALIDCNPRNLEMWLVLLYGFLFDLRVYVHGHGVFKKEPLTLTHKIYYGLIVVLCERYICYNEFAKSSFEGWLSSRLKKKLAVVNNTLENAFPVPPQEKTGEEHGVLFIGRIREGTGLDFLFQAFTKLKSRLDGELKLHVIGSGDYLKELENTWKNTDVVFHGEVYTQAEIAAISKDCFCGCYPGRAGLSVVHYMSLSLPVITHSNMAHHQGPEPAYIEQNYNGILIEEGSIQQLEDAIELLFKDKSRRNRLMDGAYSTYEKLAAEDFPQKILDVISAEESVG